jgi:hypothetical protein
MSEETWKSAPDFPDYEVSNQGNIRRSLKAPARQGTTPGQLIKQAPNKHGYGVVTLRRSGETFTVNAHELIAATWLKAPKGKGYSVNHRDRKRLNNHPDNLEWILSQDNSGHGRITQERMDEIYDLLVVEGLTPREVAKVTKLRFGTVSAVYRELVNQGRIKV